MTEQFTPTQKRIMEILKDGHAHPVAELWAVLGDDQAHESTLRVHISFLRKILQVNGLDIISEHRMGTGYRLVRNIIDDE